MTAGDALERVKAIYAEKGVPFPSYVSVEQDRERTGSWFSPRRKVWVVKTDVDRRGGNQIFKFDDATGELLQQHVTPR